MKPSTSLILLNLVFFTSCAPSFYSPNMQNVPCLKQKGELKANASIGFDGVDVQIAHAPLQNIGLQLNYANYSQESGDFNSLGRGKGIEFGIGYFKKSHNFVFETYALFAKASFENIANFTNPINPEDDGKIESDFSRLAVQPSIGYVHNNFEVALSTRISKLHYYNTVGNYTEYSTNLGSYLRNTPNHFLVEPAITLRLGLKNVKFQLQIVKAFNLKDEYSFSYEGANMFAGLVLQI